MSEDIEKLKEYIKVLHGAVYELTSAVITIDSEIGDCEFPSIERKNLHLILNTLDDIFEDVVDL